MIYYHSNLIQQLFFNAVTKRYRFTTLEKKDNKFELHLHNNYTNEAIAMVLELKDFARMFESLEEYFERERESR